MTGITNYFRDFQKVEYRFGSNELPVKFQDLSVYIDLFDQVSNFGSFYENYQVQNNERPDNASQTLYDRPDYHWTFFLLNPHLRQSGWSLDNFRMFQQAKEYYPYITVMTSGAVRLRAGGLDGMYVSSTQSFNFIEGKSVWFYQSKLGGKIVKINHDLGQYVIEIEPPLWDPYDPTDLSYIKEVFNSEIYAVGEELKEDLMEASQYGAEYELLVNSLRDDRGVIALDAVQISGPPVLNSSFTNDTRPNPGITWEYDSIHHFENVEGDHVFPGYYQPGPSYNGSVALNWSDVNTVQSLTYLERLQALNDEQRAIKVIRPDTIEQVVNEFNSLLKI